MAINDRIFYAVQKVGLKGARDTGAYTQVHGVQSVGMTTNFNLDQVFELGQLSIYENIESLPDVEVTMSKVLDGYPPAYLVATYGSALQRPTDATLNGRSAITSKFALAIYPDTNTTASGSPQSQVECSGMYVSSVAYNFPLDDNFSEDLTLVGNNKVWAGDTRIADPAQQITYSFDGGLDGNDVPIGTGGVNRRENMNFAYDGTLGVDSNGMVADPATTILPTTVFGISSSGTNEESQANKFDAHISNITCSVDLGREEINELGRKGPYSRYITFPVEVTTEIEVTSSSGDMVSATEDGILTPAGTSACEDSGNLSDSTIRLATCEGLRVYTGLRNKLASVNYTGGDAGGGNVSVTYTYTTFNNFTVMHVNDPSIATHDKFNPQSASGQAYLIN